MSPALVLAGMAEEELALVLDGRIDELAELHARREPVTAALLACAPGSFGAADIAALERAAGAQQLVSLALAERHAAVQAELAGLHRGRSAAHGYAASAA